MGEQRVEWNKTSSVAAKISNFFTPTLRSHSAFRVFLQTRYPGKGMNPDLGEHGNVVP